MFLLFLLAVEEFIPIVRYSSTIQIENVYSQNRLSVTTEPSFNLPQVYSSRSPFDDGWLWTIEPSEENMSLAKTPVYCGDKIKLINPITHYMVSIRTQNRRKPVLAITHPTGPQDLWQVVCESGNEWTQYKRIQLMNVKDKCYLSTGFVRQKELTNQFNVTCSPLSDQSVWQAAEGVYFEEAGLEHHQPGEYKDEL